MRPRPPVQDTEHRPRATELHLLQREARKAPRDEGKHRGLLKAAVVELEPTLGYSPPRRWTPESWGEQGGRGTPQTAVPPLATPALLDTACALVSPAFAPL